MAEEQAGAATQGAEQQFAIQKIYTKDVSFEAPGTPGVFRKQWQPQMSVDVNTRSSAVDAEGNFEVVLTLTVTAKVEEESAFLIEVQQAGIFFVKRSVSTTSPGCSRHGALLPRPSPSWA